MRVIEVRLICSPNSPERMREGLAGGVDLVHHVPDIRVTIQAANTDQDIEDFGHKLLAHFGHRCHVAYDPNSRQFHVTFTPVWQTFHVIRSPEAAVTKVNEAISAMQ